MQGRDKSLLVRINRKWPALYQMTEVAYGPENAKEFPVKGRPFLLIWVLCRELCTEECERLPTRWTSLFQDGAESDL